jgi:hypothetical protein
MTVILANVITSDMGLIPGLAIAGPALGLPLSVLASFLERPFVSLAGVRRHAIWYSLQANCISLLVLHGAVWGRALAPYHTELQAAAGLGSILLFVAAFVVPKLSAAQSLSNEPTAAN